MFVLNKIDEVYSSSQFSESISVEVLQEEICKDIRSATEICLPPERVIAVSGKWSMMSFELQKELPPLQ